MAAFARLTGGVWRSGDDSTRQARVGQGGWYVIDGASSPPADDMAPQPLGELSHAWRMDPGFGAIWGHAQYGIPEANRDNVVPEFEIAASGAVALSGTLTLAGDLTYESALPLEQSGAVALSGTLTLAGDLQFSDAPVSTPAPPFTGVAGGGGMSNAPRKHQATIDAEEWEDAQRLRIQKDDEMVLDCITALVAAGVL